MQGKDPSVDITQEIVEESEDERFEDVSDTAPPIDLPPPELGKLEEISEVGHSFKHVWHIPSFLDFCIFFSITGFQHFSDTKAFSNQKAISW